MTPTKKKVVKKKVVKKKEASRRITRAIFDEAYVALSEQKISYDQYRLYYIYLSSKGRMPVEEDVLRRPPQRACIARVTVTL